MVEVKGSTLVPRWHYLKEHGTAEQIEKVKQRLPEGMRRIADGGLLHNQWYPFEYFVALNRVLDEVLGRGDLALIPVLGRDAAQRVLPTVYRVFYRIGSPDFIITQAARVWRQYYNSGRLSLERIGPKRVDLLILEFETPAVEHCLSIQGWLEKTLELSGGRDIKVHHSECRTRGHADCRYQAEWR
mgnify:CR=1 FL=1